MKITTLILFACFMQLSAEVHSQISISERNVPITSVLAKIQQQSGYNLFYENTKINDVKVNVKLSNVTLKDALDQVLKDHNLTYAIVDKTIVVKLKKPSFLDRMVDAFTPPIDVRGVVRDAEGDPLAGATVRVKGINRSVLTDGEGKFYLANVDEKAVLLVSYVGYKEMEIGVKSELSIQLETKTNDLDETIVVAYGTTTQRSNTGSLTVIKGEQIANLPNASFDKGLQGLVPGLQVVNGTGQPGGGVSNFVLRGITTGTDAVNGSTVRNPLIVIDGIPVSQDHFQIDITTTSTPISNPLAQINPADIESITVLKDAAAISLYGSKASNGVILVTTKKGILGKTTLSFQHRTDVAARLKANNSTLSNEQYMELLFETYRNTNPTLWTDAAIRKDLYSKFPYRINGNDTSFYEAPDWFDALYTDHAATTVDNLSVSGGNEKSKFYINLEYSQQDGVVKATGYDRSSLRVNLESKPASFFKVGMNNLLSYSLQNYANAGEEVISFGMAPVMSPLNPIRLDNGNYVLNYSWGSTQSASNSGPNPVAAGEYNINRINSFRGMSMLYGELSFFKWFTFSSNLGVDFMLSESKLKNDPRLKISGFLGGIIQDRDIRRANIISTNTLRFNKILGKHHLVNLMISQEAQIQNQKLFSGEVRGMNLTSPYFDELSSPRYTMQSLGGTNTRQTLLSQFSQGSYSYDNRYFLTASARRDGSSRFGEDQRWGTYWSVGAGWIVSDEKFIKRTTSFVNFFKLRGSIGAAGSSGAVQANTQYDLLTNRKYQGQEALISATLSNGGTPGNPDIQWEQTFTWDAGLEARFINSLINVTVDMYNKKTSNLIYTINLPFTSGYSSVQDNIGDMKNHGVELSLSGDVLRSKKFSWNISANWSRNINKLVKANVQTASLASGYLANEVGRNFNSFYMSTWGGVDPENGAPLWLDTSGNKTSTYNQNLRSFVGKPQPDGFGSVNTTVSYKGLQVSGQFYYQYGGLLYDGSRATALLNDGATPYTNQLIDALDRWTKKGDVTANPIRKLNNATANRPSTRYLFDSDYIRFKHVIISYKVPGKFIEKISLKSLNVYAQANNIAIWSKFPGDDPDGANIAGSVNSPYPQQRSFSIGLNANL